MHLKPKQDIIRYLVYQPTFKILSQKLPVGSSVEPPRVTNNIWPVPCSELGNDDVIEFSYRLLATTSSCGMLDDRCDIPIKGLAAPWVV